MKFELDYTYKYIQKIRGFKFSPLKIGLGPDIFIHNFNNTINMNNFVLAWDVETTGLSPREDFIIQLAAARFDKTTGEVVKTNKWYIKPAHAYEISPKAQEVHGLTKEFIEENGRYFKDVAPEFFEMMEDADLLTYNGNSLEVYRVKIGAVIECSVFYFRNTVAKNYRRNIRIAEQFSRDLSSTRNIDLNRHIGYF